MFGPFGAGNFFILIRGWNSSCPEKYWCAQSYTPALLWIILTIIFWLWRCPDQQYHPLLSSSYSFVIFWRNWTPTLYPGTSWISCSPYSIQGSTHHFTTDMSPTLKMIFNFIIPLRYINTHLIFLQSSSSAFSNKWWWNPLPPLCIGVPCHSWTEAVLMCGERSVPTPLIGNMFHSHYIPWRGGQSPGWLLLLPNYPVTLVKHCLGILSGTHLPLLVRCSRGPFPNRHTPPPCALQVLHKF